MSNSHPCQSTRSALVKVLLTLQLPVLPFIAMLCFPSLIQAQSLTAVQKAIVNAARNASGASPASQTKLWTAWNGKTWQTWKTDTADGDGGRMRTAIKRFAQWRSANQKKSVPTSLITSMKKDLSTYRDPYGTQLVNRIINQYDTKQALCRCSLATPQTDDQTLTFLGIRQQCREWVDVIVIRAGGTPRLYNTSGIQTDPKKFRAGMGLFFPSDPQHASIITEIAYNSNGSVNRFKIAESNWPSSPGQWTNPPGMVPWERTLQNSRSLDWLGNNKCRVTGTTKTYACQVVSFE